MPIPGQTLGSALQNKVAELEGEAESCNREIKSGERTIEARVAEREQIYARLAKVYLPELTAQSVVTTLTEMQTTVQRCFQQKQARRQQLQAALQSCRERRETEQARLAKLTETIEAKAAERAQIESRVAEQLSRDSLYQQSKHLADQNQTALDSSKARAESFQKEAAAKLTVYETEPLFKYLVQAGFGVDGYRRSSFIQGLDGWVANAVNFRESKKNYDRLKALPKFIQEEIQQQQSLLDGVVAEMRRLEDAAAAPHGLSKVIAEGQALIEQRTSVSAGITALDNDFQKQTVQLTELDGEKDEFHRQALDQMKTYLRGETLADLKAAVRATPDRADDQCVQRLEEMDREISELKQNIAQAKQRQNVTTQQISQLSSQQSWFSNQDYQTSRSRFPDNLDINGLLSGFLIGQITSNLFRSTITRGQYFEPEPRHRSSGGYSSNNDSSGGGGWDFGGWSGGSSGGGSSDSGGGGSFDSGGGGGGFSSSDSSSSGGYSSSDSF